MGKVIVGLLAITISVSANAEPLGTPAGEKSLNTANVIRAAWELKRLSESLAPNVDTRCYIAKLAASKAEDLPDSAKVVEKYKKTKSDDFAIESVRKAMKEFEDNEVNAIADKCRENDS